MRKSSRGNPWHDHLGRFCHGPEAKIDTWGNEISDEQRSEAVLSSEQSEEYYKAKTQLRNGEVGGVLDKQEPKPVTHGFTPAKSIMEAETYAREELGVKAFYKGMDLSTANTCNERLKETFEQFPKTREHIRVIGVGQEINKEIKKRITPLVQRELDERYQGAFPQSTIDRAVKKNVNRHTHNMTCWAYFRRSTGAGGDEARQISSEYSGIYLDKKSLSKTEEFNGEYQRTVERKFHPQGTDNDGVKSTIDHELGHAIDHAYGISGMFLVPAGTRDEIENGLSRYALKNKKEYIAEAWCEYRNSLTPRERAVEVGKFMVEVANE